MSKKALGESPHRPVPVSVLLAGRTRRRGAAMVEAGLVLPVLVCFLGLGVMMFRGYETKIAQNHAIRGRALSFAAHDCDERAMPVAAGSGAVSREETTLAAPGSIDDTASGRAMAARSPAVSGRSGYASAHYADTTVKNPFPSKATEGKGLTLKVRGERSVTLCNDAPMDGDLASMAETIGSEVTTAAGGHEDTNGGREDFLKD
jgi:hypothetical protein